MAIEFENPTFGGTVLIKEAIQSQNFVSGSNGWKLWANGDAELNGVIIRGDLESLNYVAGTSGWKLDQNGDAEFNNIIIRGDGTGDTILIGGSTSPQVGIGSNANVGFIRFPTNRTVEDDESVIVAGAFNTGAANEYLSLQIKGPTVTGSPGQCRLQLNSDSQDGTIAAGALFTANTQAPRFAAAPVSGADSALFVNSSGTHTGNLIRVQKSGVDALVINNAGDTAVSGTLTDTATGIRYRPSQVGTATVNFAAVTQVDTAIVFPVAWPAGVTPVVTCSRQNGPANSAKVTVNATGISNTGFTMRFNSGDGTALNITGLIGGYHAQAV